MNKKLIKIIASITCGLGMVSSVPTISTLSSCSAKEKRIALPDTVYKISDDGTTILGFVDKFDQTQYKNCNTMVIPSGITSVDYQAFYGKTPTYIKYLEFPEGLKTIREESFAYCHYIKEIKFPDSLQTINTRSFIGCGGLKSLNIPANLSSIDGEAFEYCYSITKIKVAPENQKYGLATNLGSKAQVLIKKTGNEAIFTDKTNIEGKLACGKIVIPNTIKELESDAFYHCSSITSITFNQNFEEIYGVSFAGCYSLKKVVLPKTIKTIYSNAFMNCTSLTSINFPNGLLKIGDSAFSGCKSLSKVTLPESLTTIGYCSFMYTNLGSITIPKNVTSIGDEAFAGCDKLKKVSISSQNETFGFATNLGAAKVLVKKINDEFKWTTQNSCVGSLALGDITFPNDLKTIPNFAFKSCSNITSLKFPDNLSLIGEYAFAWCSSITKIDLSNTGVILGTNAFVSCSSVNTLILSNQITKIDQSTFDGCKSLSEIIWIGLSQNPTTEFVNTCFSGICSTGTVRTDSDQYKSSQLLDWLQDKDGGYQSPKGGFPTSGWTAA